MLFKNSFLDAYIALNGSHMTNAAMLVAVALLLKSPEELSEDNPYKPAMWDVYIMSIIAHALSVILGVLDIFEATRNSRPTLMI